MGCIIQLLLEETYQETHFHLPGDVQDSAAFSVQSPRHLKHRWDGAETAEGLESLETIDSTALPDILTQATQGGEFSEEALTSLRTFLGIPDVASASWEASETDLFSYRGEVAIAHAAYPRMRESLGLPPPESIP